MHLNSGTVDVFMPASIAGASDQLRESMLGIAKMLATLERVKLQQQIVEEAKRQQQEWLARQARARVRAAMADQQEKNRKKGTGNVPKKPRKDLTVARADDDNNKEEEEDLEVVMEKGKRKRATNSLYSQIPTTSGYATTGQDRTARMFAWQAKEERELAKARKKAPEPDPADEEEEEDRWMESDLAKRVRQKKLEEQKQQREKAKMFSKDMNEGRWKPKTAASVIDTKKKKKMWWWGGVQKSSQEYVLGL